MDDLRAFAGLLNVGEYGNGDRLLGKSKEKLFGLGFKSSFFADDLSHAHVNGRLLFTVFKLNGNAGTVVKPLVCRVNCAMREHCEPMGLEVHASKAFVSYLRSKAVVKHGACALEGRWEGYAEEIVFLNVVVATGNEVNSGRT